MDIARDAVGGGTPAAAGRPAASPHPGSAFGRAGSPEGASSASAGRTVGSDSSPPVRPTLAKLIKEVRAAFSARFHLFELEAKRAAWSAAYMLGFAAAAALLAVTAWLIAIGALVYGAVVAGVPWIVAAVVAIALHAVAVFLLVRAIRAMVDNLTFAATRRTLSDQSAFGPHDASSA